MNLVEVKKKAKEMGINPGKMRKSELIHAIQIRENNYPCFGTATGYCDQDACLWQKDCIVH